MPSNFELHILKVQGVTADLSIVGCYVSLDGRLYDVITPLSSQTPDSVVLLPSTGQLKLMIKKMSSGDDQVIGSVSFSLSLFPSVGGQFWVPLFESYEEDAVTALGTETQGPKLLLKVTMPRMLPPVNETTENSIEDSSLEQFSHAKAEEESNLSRVTFGDVSMVEASKDEHSSIKQEDRDSHVLLISDLKSQLENLQQMLRLEKSQRESQESKLKAVFSEYEAAQKRMMAREKTLTTHLLEKDKELFRCIEENTELKIAARQTESEMYQLQEKIRLMEAQAASAALSSSSEALEFALEQLRESEQRRKELQSQMLSSADLGPHQDVLAQLASLQARVATLESENSDLRAKEHRSSKEAQLLREQLMHSQHESDYARNSLQATPEVKLDVEVIEGLSSRTTPSAVGSVIDRLLDEYFEERSQSNPFTRAGENVYQLGDKKLTLAIRHGALVARTNTGFVYLEEVLKSVKKADAQKQPFAWNAPRLVSGGRSTSAGRERRHSAEKEPIEAPATARGHKKGESEVPLTATRERPVSPKKQVVSPVLFKPVKTSITPLKERGQCKKTGAVSAEKGRKPFR